MSAKSGFNWRFSERSVYCFGREQAEKMPFRIVCHHNTKQTFYGFLNVRLALNFLYEKVNSANEIGWSKSKQSFFYRLDDVILISKVAVSDLLIQHYHCPVISTKGW